MLYKRRLLAAALTLGAFASTDAHAQPAFIDLGIKENNTAVTNVDYYYRGYYGHNEDGYYNENSLFELPGKIIGGAFDLLGSALTGRPLFVSPYYGSPYYTNSYYGRSYYSNPYSGSPYYFGSRDYGPEYRRERDYYKEPREYHDDRYYRGSSDYPERAYWNGARDIYGGEHRYAGDRERDYNAYGASSYDADPYYVGGYDGSRARYGAYGDDDD